MAAAAGAVASGVATTPPTTSGAEARKWFDTAAHLIAEVADALHYAHGQGVFHRDIKSANLMLSRAGRLCITDFGLARVTQEPAMTVSGLLVGSPACMSPEQVVAGRISIDHRTDVYSLGVVLYEMVTFRLPFLGDTREAMLTGIMTKDPPRPRSLNPRVPIDLETICLKAMEKDPDRRYLTAGEMAEDLRRFLQRDLIAARRAGPARRAAKYVRRYQVAATAVLATVTVAAAAIHAWTTVAGDATRLHLVWINRAGQVERTIGQTQEGLIQPRLSPDGSRVAVSAQEADNRDIWIQDVARGTKTRLTFDPAVEAAPAWSADGSRVSFTRIEGPGPGTYMQKADGTGAAELITRGYAAQMSRDGRHLACSVGVLGAADLVVPDLQGDRQPSGRVQTPAAELWPAISPDGQYLAYQSNESGRDGIHIRRFPAGEGRWQVSATAGVVPRWSPRGNELFFIAADDLMAVEVQVRPSLGLGTPKKLFSGRSLNIPGMADYDVAADGRRFVFIQSESGGALPRITVVENWYREFAAAQ